MSVSIGTIQTIMFARNPVLVELLSNDSGTQYAAKGPRANMTAGSSDMFAEDETFTVEYEDPDGFGQTIVFTAKPNYTDDESYIPDDSWGGTLTEYWNAIRDIVQAHHLLSPYFTVTRTGPLGGYQIRIQTNSAETGWSVTTDDSHGFTHSVTAATSDTTPANYRVRLEVFFEKTYLGGDYVLAAQLEGAPGTDGYTRFDISQILEAQCRAWRPEPFVPTFGTDAAAIADNLRRYYVRYTEEYGTPAEMQPWEYDGLKYCVDGGLSQELFGEYYGAALSAGYFSDLDETDCVFSWMPDGKSISLDAPEYHAWHNHTTGTASVVLQVVAYSVDTGSAATPEYVYADFSARRYETVLFPVAPDILTAAGVTAFDGDTYKFDVRVVDAESDYAGGDPVYLGPKRTYYIDRTYYESKRYVQYLNSFGCPEVWRCTGELDKKLKVDRSTAVRGLQPGYNSFATDQHQYARAFNQELVYRTGYLRRGEAEVLQEMLLCGELYDVSTDGYIPLQILTESFAVTSTYENRHAYQFNVRPRLDMRNYSKKKLIAAADANAWQEVGPQAWFDTFLISWDLP